MRGTYNETQNMRILMENIAESSGAKEQSYDFVGLLENSRYMDVNEKYYYTALKEKQEKIDEGIADKLKNFAGKGAMGVNRAIHGKPQGTYDPKKVQRKLRAIKSAIHESSIETFKIFQGQKTPRKQIEAFQEWADHLEDIEYLFKNLEFKEINDIADMISAERVWTKNFVEKVLRSSSPTKIIIPKDMLRRGATRVKRYIERMKEYHRMVKELEQDFNRQERDPSSIL